jgi:hypothetical protein
LSWLKHFGGEAVPTVSYTHFADLVAREITGKASSPSGKAAIERSAPAQEIDQGTIIAAPRSDPSPIPSPEKQEQPNGKPSETSQRPKRIVTRVPDVDWLVHGIKREPKE